MPHFLRQLIRTGKIELGRKEFGRIHRGEGVDEVEVGKEFALMRGQIEFEIEREITSYKDIWRLFRHRVLV